MDPESNKELNTEWIDRYLLGDLKGEELEQFIHRLHTDAAFHREVTLQRFIAEQAKQVGREDMQKQLRNLHRQLGFAPARKSRLPFNFYAIAAAIALLLAATFVFYFYYPGGHGSVNQTVSSAEKPTVSVQPALIPFQRIAESPDMGFSGVPADSTITILIYPALSMPPAYRFDDTLRLYGTFAGKQLTLQYEEKNEQYTLLMDSLSYPLQRYQRRQSLRKAP